MWFGKNSTTQDDYVPKLAVIDFNSVNETFNEGWPVYLMNPNGPFTLAELEVTMNKMKKGFALYGNEDVGKSFISQ